MDLKNSNDETEEKVMSYGTDTNLNDIIGLRGVGVGGYGAYGAGAGLGYGQFASPSANAVRMNRNDQNVENQADCTRSVIGLGMDSIRQSFDSATRSREFAAVCKSGVDSEFRTSDRLAGISKEITDSEFRSIARENSLRSEIAMNNISSMERAHSAEIKALECCCKLDAKMEALDKGVAVRELNRAEREVIALRTEISRCQPCPTPCPCP